MFREVLPRIDGLPMAKSVVMSLGLTLSPLAAPVVWEFRDRFDDPELDPYAGVALKTLLRSGPEAYADVDLASRETREAFTRAAALLEPTVYHYHGMPAFPGTMTKELVVAAIAASRTSTPLVSVFEVELLEAFSGVRSPVHRDDRATEDDVRAVFGYVQRIAAMTWDQGAKYFHGHRVSL